MLDRDHARFDWLVAFISASLNVPASTILRFVDQAVDSGLGVEDAEGWLRVGAAVRNKKRSLLPSRPRRRS
jgi:hypothetical protein